MAHELHPLDCRISSDREERNPQSSGSKHDNIENTCTYRPHACRVSRGTGKVFSFPITFQSAHMRATDVINTYKSLQIVIL